MAQRKNIWPKPVSARAMCHAKVDKTESPTHLTAVHRAELQEDSGVPDDLLHHFQSMDDAKVIAKSLNRKQWKGGPGWLVRGVAPLTGQSTDLGLQFKPDIPLPPTKNSGKPLKYVTPSGSSAAPLFLQPSENYWLEVREDLSKLVLITEGAKKAACLIGIDHPAISLSGVWNGQKDGELQESLKLFLKLRRTVVLCFDMDQFKKVQVMMALDRLGRLVVAEGAVVKVALWDPEHKGIDDLWKAKEEKAVKGAIANAITFEKWRKEYFETALEQEVKEQPTYAQYQRELNRIETIESREKRDFEVARLASSPGMPSTRAIERALSERVTRARMLEEGQTTYSLGEFLALQLEAESWLIPEMLPMGETVILSSLPKTGKSLLAYDLAFSVATGNEFIGLKPCLTGNVLIIQSDESKRSCQKRLKKRGFDQVPPDRVMVVTAFALRDLGRLEAIVDEFKPVLTIIDSLKSISKKSDVQENDSEFADNIYELRDLLERHDSAGVLIHHNNKSRDNKGIEKLRGSSAIGGAVWGVWILSSASQSENASQTLSRQMEIVPRDGERKILSVELVPEINTWDLIGSSVTPDDELGPQQRVINFLTDNAPRAYEPIEICNQVEGKSDSIRKILSRLASNGTISKRESKKNAKAHVYFIQSSISRDRDIDRDNRDIYRDTDRDKGSRNGVRLGQCLGRRTSSDKGFSESLPLVSPSRGADRVSVDRDIDRDNRDTTHQAWEAQLDESGIE